MLAFVVILLVIGLIAGAIARLLLPGRDPIGLLGKEETLSRLDGALAL